MVRFWLSMVVTKATEEFLSSGLVGQKVRLKRNCSCYDEAHDTMKSFCGDYIMSIIIVIIERNISPYRGCLGYQGIKQKDPQLSAACYQDEQHYGDD